MVARGFDAIQIGEVMAIIMAGRVVAPTLWGWLADLRGDARLTMVASAACTLLAFVSVPFLSTFAALAVAMALFSVGLSGVIPQFEAHTLNHLGVQAERYGQVRLWGSVGFIAAVTGSGALFDFLPVLYLPWIVSTLLLCMLIGTCLTPVSAPVAQDSPQASMLSVVLEPRVLALLLVCFLVQASFGPYYVFFSVFLAELGYSAASIGALWALAVAAEIVVFVYAGRLLRRYSLTNLFRVAVGLCILRWIVTAELAANPLVLFAAQLTHMATFGLYHLVAVTLIHRFFTGPLQVRGQGLYSSLSFGAGGVAGSVLSGYAWQQFGASMTYYLAAAIAAAAFLITLLFMRASRTATKGAGIVEKN